MNYLKDKNELTSPVLFGKSSSRSASPMLNRTLNYLSSSPLLKQRQLKINQTVITNGESESLTVQKPISNENSIEIETSSTLTNNCIVNGFKSLIGLNQNNSSSSMNSFYKLDSLSTSSSVHLEKVRDETQTCASQFIDPVELKKRLFEMSSKFLVILLDCRTYTDFNSKHIKDSVHLNCRDKLTKKRLQSRKLTVKDLISCEEVKSKFETNESKSVSEYYQSAKCVEYDDDDDDEHLDGKFVKLNKKTEEVIVLIDDTTSDLNDLQSESNPLKIVQENIKQSGYKKECKILKGGFKMFSQMCPEFCVLKEASQTLKNREPMPEFDLRQSDIDNAVMTQILPFLYLGNECDAKNISKLEKNEIYYILNVTKNIPFYESSTGNKKFNFKRIGVNDNGNQKLNDHFEEAFEFIDQAKKNNLKVLVHCQAGISRSPTIVIAYLMKKNNLKFNEAYNNVRDLRPIIAPNLIFMSQLMDYETRLDKIRSTNETSTSDLGDDDLSSSSNSSSSSSSTNSSTDTNKFFSFSNNSIQNEKSSILVM